ncbi:MAG: M23 family metallopeptidase [Thermodesulfovibrionales bacterium]
MIEANYIGNLGINPLGIKPSSNDPQVVSKQIEKVFLNELLKTLFESTELGKNRTIGPYIPIFASEMSDMFSERGIGVGEFLTRRERLKETKGEIDNKGIAPNSLQKVDSDPEEKNSIQNENISARDYLNAPVRLQMPVQGTITSKYGIRRDPFDGTKKRHYGIDIATRENTEIRASAAGKVVYSAEAGSYGRVVIIEHDNGISTLYAHNSKNLVSRGDHVKAGQVIALSGSSGRSTGPHLHFEVRLNGEAVDPLSMIG